MTFEQYLARLVAANPNLNEDDTKITVTVSVFKTQLHKSYEEGKNHADSVRSIIDDIFGPSRRGRN